MSKAATIRASLVHNVQLFWMQLIRGSSIFPHPIAITASRLLLEFFYNTVSADTTNLVVTAMVNQLHNVSTAINCNAIHNTIDHSI